MISFVKQSSLRMESLMNENDAQEDLVFIKKIIADSRKIVAHDGNEFIVWGIIAATGMIAMYINIAFQYYINFGIIWGVLIGAGWCYSIFRWATYYKKMPVRTFAGKVLSSVWVSCGIVMSLIGFALAPLGVINGWAIMPLIALVTGIAYFISSIVMTEKWILYSAYGWWIGAMVIAWFPGQFNFLLYAGMLFCFQIIPGILLQKKYRNQLTEHNA
jgi:hypothetical protein